MNLAMPVLETSRLTIRPFSVADLEATADILHYPEVERRDLLEWTVAEYKILARLHQPPLGDRAVELKATGELVGRRLDDVGRIAPLTLPHPVVAGVETMRLLPEGATTTTLVAAGVKWNAGSSWIVRASVLVPLSSAGLTARAIPAPAVEWSY